jgi:hypothetical protein
MASTRPPVKLNLLRAYHWPKHSLHSLPAPCQTEPFTCGTARWQQSHVGGGSGSKSGASISFHQRLELGDVPVPLPDRVALVGLVAPW